MSHIHSPALEKTGFVVLDRHDQAADPEEWLDLAYVPWRSSGVTRFAPLTSYSGEQDCNGFWNHTPPRTDKDGVWVESQTALAPTLVRRAREAGANIGRCRVVELQPSAWDAESGALVTGAAGVAAYQAKLDAENISCG